MSTVTKTWSFASTVEGLVFENASVGKITFGHDGATGNPAGSIFFSIDGRNTATSDWANTSASANTWEDWGVPAGATVTGIRITDWEKRVTIYNVVTTPPTFTVQVRDNTGSLDVGTGLLVSTSVGTATDASFQTMGSYSQQSVQSSYQASNTGIHLRLGYVNGDLGNDKAAEVHTLFDNIDLEIEYTPAVTKNPAHLLLLGVG